MEDAVLPEPRHAKRTFAPERARAESRLTEPQAPLY